MIHNFIYKPYISKILVSKVYTIFDNMKWIHNQFCWSQNYYNCNQNLFWNKILYLISRNLHLSTNTLIKVYNIYSIHAEKKITLNLIMRCYIQKNIPAMLFLTNKTRFFKLALNINQNQRTIISIVITTATVFIVSQFHNSLTNPLDYAYQPYIISIYTVLAIFIIYLNFKINIVSKIAVKNFLKSSIHNINIYNIKNCIILIYLNLFGNILTLKYHCTVTNPISINTIKAPQSFKQFLHKFTSSLLTKNHNLKTIQQNFTKKVTCLKINNKQIHKIRKNKHLITLYYPDIPFINFILNNISRHIFLLTHN